ncbi:MAG: hypothetical protein K5746_03415 [Clostridiales bacterium]|nr:hypothetical protein [Clostridiales bacterium]
MRNGTWARLTAGLTALVFLLAALLVIFVDPFEVYRKATLYTPPIDNTTQVYSNAGIVRNYDYDSAMVGSSVTENFKPSEMDEKLGGRFVKLVTSAATAKNHQLLLRLAFKTHGLRRVVYGLDVYSFVALPEETGSEVPLYLYDDNPANDVRYWLNRSVLFSFLPRCLKTWGQAPEDSLRDSMYSWAGRDKYGKIALYNASFTKPEEERNAEFYLARGRVNLDGNLLPFVQEHPETRFDFFFPPYSAAEWASMKSRGTLPGMLALRGLLYDALSPYENVRLFDFSAREEWVLDLSNYKDTLHYGEWINSAIVEAIAEGDGLVASHEQLDAATDWLRARAEEQIEAGGWLW